MLLAVALLIPSSLYISTGGALYASLRPPNLFDPASLVDAVDWLGEHAGTGDAVMASERSGLLIPPRTGLQTYIGHPIETLDYAEKALMAEAFYAEGGMTIEERRQLLASCGCDWVMLGPYESQDENTVALDLPMELTLAYQGVSVSIYQVP